jgi:hypothetical protein
MDKGPAKLFRSTNKSLGDALQYFFPAAERPFFDAGDRFPRNRATKFWDTQSLVKPPRTVQMGLLTRR